VFYPALHKHYTTPSVVWVACVGVCFTLWDVNHLLQRCII